MNPTYLKEIDGQLNKAGNTSLVVRKGQNIVYLPAKLQGLDKEELPPFGLFGEVDPVEQINHQFISIKKLDFSFLMGQKVPCFL